ncbi:MAG: ATP-dependent DNA ligase, partial [Actinomycetota bacterium]|nr:ATP-dependent DNA ligase [Actinomycetota bacterium]
MADELGEYRAKRRRGRTPEPGVDQAQGKAAKASRSAELASDGPDGDAPRFVVDWHSARRLHFDLRLELDGVAKSWAVPKGPPLQTGLKRLAVQTEDHPLEYLEWEGDIPEGEYGAGKMRIWDRGTFELEKRTGGELKVRFHGEKLTGSYVLVKTRGERDWLLIRHRQDGEGEDGYGLGAHGSG